MIDIAYIIIVYAFIAALCLRAFKKSKPIEEAALEASIWPVTLIIWLWRKVADI